MFLDLFCIVLIRDRRRIDRGIARPFVIIRRIGPRVTHLGQGIGKLGGLGRKIACLGDTGNGGGHVIFDADQELVEPAVHLLGQSGPRGLERRQFAQHLIARRDQRANLRHRVLVRLQVGVKSAFKIVQGIQRLGGFDLAQQRRAGLGQRALFVGGAIQRCLNRAHLGKKRLAPRDGGIGDDLGDKDFKRATAHVGFLKVRRVTAQIVKQFVIGAVDRVLVLLRRRLRRGQVRGARRGERCQQRLRGADRDRIVFVLLDLGFAVRPRRGYVIVNRPRRVPRPRRDAVERLAPCRLLRRKRFGFGVAGIGHGKPFQTNDGPRKRPERKMNRTAMFASLLG